MSQANPQAVDLCSRGPLAAMVEGLVCDSCEGLVQGINAGGCALLGYNGSDTIIGRPFVGHLSNESAKQFEALLGSLTNGGSRSIRLDLVRGDGNAIPVTLTAALIDGAKRHVLLTAVPANGAAAGEAHDLQNPASLTSQILAAAANGIIAVDLKGAIVFANAAAADLLNRDASAMNGVDVERVFVYGSGDRNAGRALPLKAQIANGPHYLDQEAHLARSDGESFEAVYAIAPFGANRRTQGYVITLRDITQRRRAEAELRLAATVFQHSPEGLIVADARGRVTKVNPAYQRIAGMNEAQAIGRALSDVLACGQAAVDVAQLMGGGNDAQWEQWCVNGEGKRYAARISVSAIQDGAGVHQYVAIVSDITQRKLDEEKIIYQANYDQLTGLPNRTLFMDRLTRRVLEGKRAKTSVGLMFIDLDGFKAINDTLGHDAGDLLLKSTARRLEKSVREADTVARLGGDEFTVIMPLIDSFEAAAIVAERIIKSLTEPFDLEGREGRISASIGISLLPGQASTASELLHNADVAMYHAKRQGKANYQYYHPELESTVEVKERVL